MPDKFYLTTPIYYVNARPHIGHAYSTLVCDVIARRQRLLGKGVFFLTGTDEHGQKIERSAKAAGKTPQAFADEVSAEFRTLWDRMGLTYSDYIRTTDPRHKQGAQKLFATLRDKGYIYKGSYTGQYCVSDEAYIDGPPGVVCPDCGNVTETVSEENYFFKLSAFEAKLLAYYEANPDFIQPEKIRNEVLSFVRSGLRDLSVSRTSFNWGIPVPGDEKHVIYVWLDALANYITAIGYGSDDSADQARFQKYWPADLHLIGKEISRFHCVYWPAFLLAADLPLPKSIVANGWLLFEESKMSKSRGNIVRTETILEAFGEDVYRKQFPDSTKEEQDLFGADVLRYFLLREIPFGQDGSFSFDALYARYNAALKNGYGNLVSRMLNMIAKYFDNVVPQIKNEAAEKISFLGTLQATFGWKEGFLAPLLRDIEAQRFDRYLQGIETLISAVDETLSTLAPWKERETALQTNENRIFALYYGAEAVRLITALLFPIIPSATARVWSQLGLGNIYTASENGDLDVLSWKQLRPGTRIGPFSHIFPNADKEIITRMSDLESKNAPASPKQSVTSKTPSAPNAVAAAHTAPVETTTHPAANAHASKPTSTPAAQQFAQPGGGAAATAPDAPKYVKDSQATQAEAPAPDADSRDKSEAPPGPPQISNQITIDDFVKIELRVAQIKVAERIPKADKLLRLEIDLGHERRQILSGIAQWYTPEELIGRRIVVITNLAPRKMRGLDSHGMLLAASENENSKPILATFSEDIALGTRLK